MIYTCIDVDFNHVGITTPTHRGTNIDVGRPNKGLRLIRYNGNHFMTLARPRQNNCINIQKASFKYMIRYARTGPALATQHGLDIGWSTTCDREYSVVVHINVVMFRGSFQCETPGRHVYTMNILHQTTCSAILVGFLHASNKKVYTLCEVDSSRR